ncbi:MAG: class I SAM-dependent methyltransferase, partial [Pyrinomonadaceae bacterium]
MNTRHRDDERGETSPLAERLRRRVGREGTISFRDWMRAALYDEREGYYCRPGLARWGRVGDYRTSAERTPLFAATFARYFAALYEELGAPRGWSIVEAGAGAGHFAHVVLETLERDHPRVFSATNYVIDEASPDARARAAELLVPYADRVEFRRLDDFAAPIEAGIIFSNELLDALPVHRVTTRDGALRELCVGLGEAGAFVWTEREPTTPDLARHFETAGVTLAEGQIAEVNLDAGRWVARAAGLLRGGYLITVDYGAEASDLYGAAHRRAGTLRAFKDHAPADDVLARPGEQDLTTTIDWTQIKRAGECAGLLTVLFERLDEFLLKAGLLEQLERMTE